jgi:hypothetical protein
MDQFAVARDTAVQQRVAEEDPGPVIRTLLRSRWALVGTGVVVLALLGATVLYLGKTSGPAHPPSAPAVPVPGNLKPAIADAARSCQVLTFARVAAQVMSVSEFDDHAAIQRGGNGIAGLTDAEWTHWMPHPTAVRGDSAANIVALAHEMCDFVGLVRTGGFAGDPWRLALASYQAGPAAVKQAGGVPNAAAAYVDEVAAYAGWYEKAEADPVPQTAPAPPPAEQPSVAPAEPSTSEPLALPPLSTQPGPVTTRSPAKPKPPAPAQPQPQPQPQPQAPAWTTVVVSATTVLAKGQSVRSNRTRLAFSADGNLEIFDEGNRLRWTSDTARRGGSQAVFQADGNLVVYDQNRQSLWTSGTGGHDGAVLVLEADGNVCVVYQSVVIWASNTAH